jgi:hypothetical protein
VFLAAIVVAAVLWFPVGYYNLTAVELIAGLLIFSWLIVLIRNLAAVDADRLGADLFEADRPAGPQIQRTGSGQPVSNATDGTAAEP